MKPAIPFVGYERISIPGYQPCQFCLFCAKACFGPALFGRIMMVANKWLPAATGAEGDRHVPGHRSRTALTRGLATVLTEQAAVANNEV